MREIKFRVWDGTEQVWRHGVRLNQDGSFDVKTPWGLNDLRIVQNTGLKGKNGVEIYEGDIVNAPYVKPNSKALSYWTTKIYFADGSFFFNGDVPYPLFGIDTNQIEVIGNIYENPGLIK